MSKIFIIGATGGVGSRLGPMLVNAGHDVTGLHRKPEQADNLENAGIIPRLGDIMTVAVEDLTEFTRDCDVVVFFFVQGMM